MGNVIISEDVVSKTEMLKLDFKKMERFLFCEMVEWP
jgi:hypothetical protein